MGNRSRKEREAEALKLKRRAEIMNAAIFLFEQRGIRNVTISHIAAEAELAKGTVYLYFKTKDDLLFHIMIDLIGGFDVAMRRAEAANGFESLKRLANIMKQDYTKNLTGKHLIMLFNGLYDTAYPEDLPSAREYERMIAAFIDRLTAMVQRGVDDGTLRPELDARSTACTLGNVFGVLGVTTAVRRKQLTTHQGADPYPGYCDVLDAFLAWIERR